jgi:hypothetical protein
MIRHNWHAPSGVREKAPERAPNGSAPPICVASTPAGAPSG